MNYYIVSESPKEKRPRILKLDGRPMPSGTIKISGRPMALGCRATARACQVFDSPVKALDAYKERLRADIDVAVAQLALARSKLESLVAKGEIEIVDSET